MMPLQPHTLSQKGLSQASTGGINCQQSILHYITTSQPVQGIPASNIPLWSQQFIRQ
jgi:hypothetical protein